MPRTIFPMAVSDMSAFAKSLRGEIDRLDHKPSHVEMLNLLSRAAGFRNFQHFRASNASAGMINNPLVAVEPEPQADETRVMRTLRVFDSEGRIVRWPTKRSQQELCLWFLSRTRLFGARDQRISERDAPVRRLGLAASRPVRSRSRVPQSGRQRLSPHRTQATAGAGLAVEAHWRDPNEDGV